MEVYVWKNTKENDDNNERNEDIENINNTWHHNDVELVQVIVNTNQYSFWKCEW